MPPTSLYAKPFLGQGKRRLASIAFTRVLALLSFLVSVAMNRTLYLVLSPFRLTVISCLHWYVVCSTPISSYQALNLVIQCARLCFKNANKFTYPHLRTPKFKFWGNKLNVTPPDPHNLQSTLTLIVNFPSPQLTYISIPPPYLFKTRGPGMIPIIFFSILNLVHFSH